MTDIEIFNRALGLLGHDRSATESDRTAASPSAEYTRCNREWDGARLSVLAAHPWNFLLQETPITQGAETTDDISDDILYEYDRPDDVIRIVEVVDGVHKRVDYRVAGGKILTDAPEIKIVYMEDEDDPTLWPSAIVDAVVAELSSRIALPMSANARMVEATKGLAIKYLSDAKLLDARETSRGGTNNNKYAMSRR